MVFIRDPSKNREDYPRRKTPQPRPRTPTADESGNFPSGTSGFGCACSDCYVGSPVAEDDAFYATCKCKNFRRYALFEALRIQKLSSDTPVTWAASGGVHKFTYQGDGIYHTATFERTCEVEDPEDEEETIEVSDDYRYELNAITRRIALVFVPPEEEPEAEPNCDLIEAEWCMQGGSCGFRCHCPWVFTVDMPWRGLAPPVRCNVCVTPKHQSVIDACGCGDNQSRLPVAIRIIGAGWAENLSGVGCDTLLLNGESTYEFTDVSPPLEGGPTGRYVLYSLGNEEGGLLQIQYCSYSDISLFCADGLLYRRLAGGSEEPLPGCDGSVQDFLENFSGANPEATLQYQLLFDQEVATGSGDDEGDCSAADPCEEQECIFEVDQAGDTKFYKVSADSTCTEECGDCYVTCEELYTNDNGNAADHEVGDKFPMACRPPRESEGAFVTASFTGFEGEAFCECGVASVQMCQLENGTFQGSVVLCGISYEITYYEDGGTYHFDGGPENGTSGSPTGPFYIGGDNGTTCTGIQVSVAA